MRELCTVHLQVSDIVRVVLMQWSSYKMFTADDFDPFIWNMNENKQKMQQWVVPPLSLV